MCTLYLFFYLFSKYYLTLWEEIKFKLPILNKFPILKDSIERNLKLQNYCFERCHYTSVFLLIQVLLWFRRCLHQRLEIIAWLRWIKSPTVPFDAAFDFGVSSTAGSTQESETDEDGEVVQERISGSTPRGINRGDVITEINAALSFRWQPKLPVLAFISRAIIRSRFSFSKLLPPSPPESNLRTRGNGFKFYLSVGLRFSCVADAAGGQLHFCKRCLSQFEFSLCT